MNFFICIDGIDGSGKSTQLKLLQQYFAERGRRAVITREPGGTPAGEAIRAILVNKNSMLEPDTEMLLFCADRAEHQTKVRQWLAEGKDVLCDRFMPSTWAYQIFGRGLKPDLLEAVSAQTVHTMPDLTIILDMDASVALARSLSRLKAEGRETDEGRFETEKISFFNRVREGFLWYSAQDCFGKTALIDANCSVEELFAKIKSEVDKIL